MNADYYSLLRRALDKLHRPDVTARREVYRRANQALVSQLRAAGSLDDEIAGHVEALDAAVRQIEHDLAGERTQQTGTRRAALEQHGRPADRRFEMSRDPVAPPRRRWSKVAVAGALLVILLAGGTAYYFGFRDRGRPAPVSQREPAQPTVTPAATGSRTTVVDVAQAPYVLRRQRVFFRTTHPAGTVVLSLNQRFLYVVQPNNAAIRYAIGIGPECGKIAGLFHIIEKVGRPPTDANPPTNAPRNEARGRFAPPALYFGQGRAVHVATEPNNIGHSSVTGCFQSWSEDIADFYDRVPLNERVVVAN